jgi:hypothetical protein
LTEKKIKEWWNCQKKKQLQKPSKKQQ